MIQTLAVANYRSLQDLVLPLERLNLVTGANGSGKSNLYRALRLLAATAEGGAVAALAREGGLPSVLWAGPERLSGAMRRGEAPIQGQRRQAPVNLRLGFADEELGYAIDFGLPVPGLSVFNLDPEIKRECIWLGPVWRPTTAVVDRQGPLVRARGSRGAWTVLADGIGPQDSLFTQLADPRTAPEILLLRERIRAWRFYDHFRTDEQAPARQAQLGTRTPVLSADGADLAAALQTIRELGAGEALDAAVADAFPGAQLQVTAEAGRFGLRLGQEGLLRPLGQAELSDGTLRYLLWIAALLTPRPPGLMVLNEPETSLHPDLLPALARLIAAAAERAQIWVVAHSPALVTALQAEPTCQRITLVKDLGRTELPGKGWLDGPHWVWPGR